MESREKGALRVGEGVQTLGVIDCLGTGFEKINGILWVIVLPIALSLFLWIGPQLSAGPAMASLIGWYNATLPAEAQDGMGALAGVQLSDAILSAVGDVNLFSFLSFGMGLAGRGAIPALYLPATPIISMPPIERPLGLAGSAIAMELLGLLLGAGFLGLIAQRVRDGSINLSRLLRRIWGYWLGMIGFLLIIGLAIVITSLPTAAVLALAFALAPGAGEIIATAVVAGWQVAAIWLTLFTFFLVDAVVVGELGPLRAAKSSIRVVGGHFWSALGFIALYLLITYGTMALWSQLGAEEWAAALSILGNAYVASGLAAASMVFYNSRAKLDDGRATPRRK